jgi:hypothetical protein
VRGEPFVCIRGKLAKDDGTVNVLAEEVEGLKLGSGNVERGAELPPGGSAFAFLKSMRRVAPGSKDWG